MASNTRITVTSIEATEELARTIASTLSMGDVVGLIGEVGAGKSVIVRAAARALGVTERMPSPTYTLVEEYDGSTVPILHIDLYRLSEPEEFVYLGVDEIFPQAITFIEWVNNAPDAVATVTLLVTIEIDPVHPDHRSITTQRYPKE